MEDLDKILSEVVRKTVKETLETIMNQYSCKYKISLF
jgi:hypothetical protein